MYSIFFFQLQAVRVEHCERVHVIAAAKRICIANCRECVFFLGVNQRPLIVGDNHKLQVCEVSLFSALYRIHLCQYHILFVCRYVWLMILSIYGYAS